MRQQLVYLTDMNAKMADMMNARMADMDSKMDAVLLPAPATAAAGGWSLVGPLAANGWHAARGLSPEPIQKPQQ